jgi:hypothetical protein
MTKDEALDLALEALQFFKELSLSMNEIERAEQAITAIKQARALDKMAENARELGLDYEPWKSSDTAHRPGGLPPDFTKHEVENEGDWSEWVNPYSEQYFMKCCDCGLVHEMQFKVAKYSEGDECEFVADDNLQAVFRARRVAPFAPVQEPVATVTSESGNPDVTMSWWHEPALTVGTKLYTTPPAAQRQWVGLTPHERMMCRSYDADETVAKTEAKLREKNNG